jgi:predicted aspartyl protease
MPLQLRILDVAPLGALIQVGVRVGVAFSNAGFGGTPRTCTALLDTGASSTAISPTIVRQVQPQIVGTTPIKGVGASSLAHTYEIQIKFEHHLQPGTWYNLEAVEAVPATPGVDILIGRDLLKNIAMFYDGPSEKLTLMF